MNYNYETFFKAFPTISTKRNRFPFKKEVNFNFKLGEITPVCWIRTVPGQTYNLDLSAVVKVAPMVNPPMDNVVIKFFAFGGPDRISWKNYKYWFGEKQKPENPELEPTYLVPKVKLPESGFGYNTFYDNIGCPPEVGGYEIDAFLPRLDRKIYNKYFRNQSLENPLEVSDEDADDDANQNMQLRKICKPRDIFTQCLPNMSGGTPVEIPLGTEAPVVPTQYGAVPNFVGYEDKTKKGSLSAVWSSTGGTIDNRYHTIWTNANKEGAIYNLGWDNPQLKTDLSKAMGAPLEGLYQAIAYETLSWIESRGGNRYFEKLANVYSVANPDGTLQDPEFLGSISDYVQFDTITQTSETTANSSLGQRGANGYYENYGSIVNKSFGEFGYILIYAVATIHPKYQQGVSSLCRTNDPLELFNPIFNRMGDEAIKRSDIYIQSDDVTNAEGQPVNDEVFGYGKRNSRLLYPINEIHGEQRSSYPQSLDTNHFAQYFSEMPKLNKDFDKVTDTAFKRSLVVQDETQFIANVLISGTQDLEIPMEAIPSPIPEQLLQK